MLTSASHDLLNITPHIWIGVSVAAFLVTVIVVALARQLALKLGVVDAPGGRKQHDEPVPPVGGIAIFTIFIAILFGSGIFLSTTIPWALIVSLGIILLVGVIDDAREIDARIKFATHFLVAAILVIGGGAQITSLGNILGFGQMGLGWMSIPFSIACVVYIINAVNMMDGLDGLAGGNALIVFLWFGLSAFWHGETETVFEIAIFCAGLLGFLFYNARSPWRKHAKVFLGDAGSMGIGVMIAWFAITLSQTPHQVIEPVSVAWVIALPIIDAFGLLVARLRDHKPPFAPDRRHFHHHFIHAGFGVASTVYIILCWSAILGAIGVLGVKLGVPHGVLGWAWAVLWLSHAALTIHAKKFIGLLSKVAQ
ncbi:MAG: undecaprenyl/decaprenyl-phosphate alpha-N-acetylglucosaminyl 1-phosphate transferase [Alphaproteobacteria bacterium]|nr:undecaprenyl/decaprenyl-phosphate alpha-N-acetylglucosaminyl 1-phosphate transferase [Alphaproteobacteria bacterium]MCB9984248.1 undecaprenyl/decaprenyl-phosphate alpha-N-acetylglucosaminyl 1-phosphate transferase [Micavibrio sp.]HPQ51124.1 MraY family glycosyltransferase [Alphaproteobacteria bacterium]